MGGLELTGTLSPQALSGLWGRKRLFFTNYTRNLLMEGDIRVCSDVVFPDFWCGFAEIFILSCGIAVLQN